MPRPAFVRIICAALLFSACSSPPPGRLEPVSAGELAKVRAREPARVAESLAILLKERASLGLGEDDAFDLAGRHTDRFGQTHGHFTQLHKGLPVWGARAVTHMDAQGRALAPTTDGLRAGIQVDVTPQVDETNALAIATRALAPRSQAGFTRKARLVVHPDTRRVNLAPDKPEAELNAVDFADEITGYRLAWHVHAELENSEDGIRHEDFLLDARTGEIIRRWNSLQTQAATGTGLSQHNGTVSVDTFHAGGVWELRDATRGSGAGNRTMDASHANLHQGAPEVLTAYTDGDNAWGDGQNYVDGAPTLSANGQTAAVDAHFGLGATWDYFRKIHGRHGIDGLGTATYNRVHVGTKYDNAFWSDACFCMSYGDGSHPAPGGLKSLAALDVAAHEMTHGVTSWTAGLIYAGESGGLNEATSDIFGAMTEFWTRGGRGERIGDVGGGWTMGEDLAASPMRFMDKPSRDGRSADAWFPRLWDIDVHYSSGPMNRAFYFLSQGAQTSGDSFSAYLPEGMAGIGNDRAAHIWYRALTVYLTPSSNYVAARVAALRAAADLHGARSAEYRAVENAFAGINVGYSAGTFDDRAAPSVTASVTGNAPHLTLQAAATDNVGVARVEFFVDRGYVGTRYSRPFALPLDASTLGNGAHEFIAVAYDAAGNRAQSAATSFQVANAFDQLLLNGGFEQGDYGWQANPPENINLPSSYARSGRGMAWLNGWGSSHTDTLQQTVTIPSSASQASLTFWLRIYTEETGSSAWDRLRVEVRAQNGDLLETLATFSNLDATGNYVQRSFDLTAWAGQTIRLHLEGSEDGSHATGFMLDDFALRVLYGADTEPPVVTARVEPVGARFAFYADVFDDGFVEEVEFHLDGVLFGSQAQSFAGYLNGTTLSSGQHTLVAKARDKAGNEGISAPVTFFVDHTGTQLVSNPGFENAALGAWTVGTTNGRAQVYTGASFARTGQKFFLFWTNPGLGTSTLRQTVTVPAGATSASYGFWLRVHSDAFSDAVPRHTLSAQVRDAGGTLLQTLRTFSNTDDTYGQYVQHRFDLSAYAGQTIQLFFDADLSAAPQVADGVTQMFLDDVSLDVSTAPDAMAPEVSASVDGSSGTIRLLAEAGDNAWVRRLEFRVDGTLVATREDPSGMQTVPFDASSLAAGAHELRVRAVDPSGNEGEAVVPFELLHPPVDVAPPEVSLSVRGTHEARVFVAEASDDTGVMNVEFYLDGVFLETVTNPPYEPALDLSSLTWGTYVLEAVAWDAHGKSATAQHAFDVLAISVAVVPAHVVLVVGESRQLSAVVENTNDTSVSWAATCGSVDVAGLYTAPAAPALCQAVATSGADPSQSASASVRVYTPDVNGDGIVDGEDMGLLSEAYGAADALIDLDGSGLVDDADVALFLPHFGRTP